MPRKIFTLNATAVSIGAAIAALSSLHVSSALADEDVEQSPESNTLSTVVSLGNRAGDRTVAESPVPIDVISGGQLQKQGTTGLKDALANAVPSFNVTKFQGSAYSNVSRYAGLRGLGGGYVLVLINGKRRINNATSSDNYYLSEGWNAADLDSIPVSAVDHVEVLRDGAAAQYGSDAVAGVINIVLKQNDNGFSSNTMTGRRSRYHSGVGANGETYQEGLNAGFALPNDGFINLALDAKSEDATFRSGGATGNFYPLINGQQDARESSVDRRNHAVGLPAIKQYNLSYNAELPLPNDLTLYSFSTFTRQNAEVGINFRRPNDNTVITELYPDGVAPQFLFDTRTWQSVAGLKGTELLGWNWDLSTSFGKSELIQNTDHNMNPSLGTSTPTSFYLQGNTFSQWTNNFDLNRQLDIGWSHPLTVATGLEFRRERYTTESGDPLSYANGGYQFPAGNALAGQYGAIGALGNHLLLPEDEVNLSRNNSAIYLDLGLNLTDKWFVSAAGRFEHYTDSSGNTTTGKLATRYQFTPELAVRGAVSTGFVAPSLTQQGYARTGLSRRLVGGTYRELTLKRVQPHSALAKELGGEELDPVTSRNYSMGLAWTPTDRLNVTLDAYLIDLKDRIALINPLSGTAVSNILASAGYSNVQQVQYYANALDTRTKGIDLVADYSQSLGKYGQLRWTAGANWNKSTVTDVADNPAVLNGLGLTRITREQLGGVTDLTPKTKYMLGLTWNIYDFDLHLQTTRYGKVKILNSNSASLDESFGAKWITNADATYHLTDNISFSVGAENLFNVYPDKHKIYDETGRNYYSQISPFGSYGAFYYSKLNIEF